MIKWPGKKQILHAMLLLPFVVLSLIAVFHHEPWRDETHTVQMVNEVGVLEAIKIINATERQPPLWHIALGFVSFFTHEFLGAALFHWAIMFASLILLFLFSPFAWYENLLISLGYFILYDYSVIVRIYGISVLILFSILAYYPWRLKRPTITCVLMGLLALTNMFGAILCFFLMLLFLFDSRKQKRLWPLLLIPAAMISLTVYFMIPPLSNKAAVAGIMPRLPGIQEVYYVVKGIINRVCCPVPSYRVLGFPHMSVKYRGYSLEMAVLFLFLIFIAAPRRCSAAAYFYFSSGAILVALVLGGGGGIRHQGFLFINLLVSKWLDWYYHDQPEIFSVRYLHDRRVLRIAFVLLLLFQAWSGLNATYIEYKHPFSGAKAAGRYLNRLLEGKNPESTLIATFMSGQTEGLVPFIRNGNFEFFSLELMEPYRVRVNTEKWFQVEPASKRYTFQEIMGRFMQVVGSGKYTDVYLVIAPRPFSNDMYMRRVYISNDIYLQPVYAAPRCDMITGDEVFYIYKLARTGGGSVLAGPRGPLQKRSDTAR